MAAHWIYDAMFYHIYPLGLCGAPERNDFTSAPVERLQSLMEWVDHLCALKLNALYLGPVFESSAHGYDTADYFQVDRRLGTHDTLKALVHTLKGRGVRVVLDGVFNHVGRDFWAFRDVQLNGRQSAYADWFHHLDFNGVSPYGDSFSYAGWAGHYDLVKLNLQNQAVRQHLFDAVTMWMREFLIDGLRIDAADQIDPDFLRALAGHCRQLNPEFWFVGEVVMGDYRRWANAEMLDSVTNYECYKGLYSSHVDHNYFEIAYSLNRLFGDDGIYRHLLLYSFADNHDVNRVASSLTAAEDLYPLYILLFTMPGIPSIYYGSEWGIPGTRSAHSDKMLRPSIHLNAAADSVPHPALAETIQRLALLRQHLPALRQGTYRPLHTAHEQFAFARTTAEQTVVAAVNASAEAVTVRIPKIAGKQLVDRLNGQCVEIRNGSADLTLYPHWGAVLTVE